MDRYVLLLGLLRRQEMHGYHINEVIQAHGMESVGITKPTAYRLLKQMTERGWVTSSEEREGDRPPRRVYAVTPEGEDAFQRLLRATVADFSPARFPSAIGVGFLDEVGAQEALSLLAQRRAKIADALEAVQAQGHHPGSMDLVIQHQARYLSMERDWVDQVISNVRERASKRSDEGEQTQ